MFTRLKVLTSDLIGLLQGVPMNMVIKIFATGCPNKYGNQDIATGCPNKHENQDTTLKIVFTISDS